MLSLHGLVIIAEEPYAIMPSKFGNYFKLQIASDDGRGGTHRHHMDVYVPKDHEQLAKEKLQVGAVCEIVHGTWSEYQSQFNRQESPGKNYSKINIIVDWRNLKFLKIPMYYENLPGITLEKKE